MSNRSFFHLAATALLLGRASDVEAQAADSARAVGPAVSAPTAPASPTYGQVISISPVFALLGFYTGEIERRVSSAATIGASGSAFTLGPFGYRSVDAKLRFYPDEHALRGLGVGISAGKVWLSADEGGLFESNSSGSGIVVGSEASYTWLTGKRHNLAFSIGGGLKRILRFAGHDVSGAQLTYPTVRASLGLAF